MYTHFNGVVRIDQIAVRTVLGWTEAEKIFSAEAPTGTEGPLTIKANAKARRFSDPIIWGDIKITGDLRDFNGVQKQRKIRDWLNNASHELRQYDATIRQGIIQIETEGKGNEMLIFFWEPETDKFKLIEIPSRH